MDCLLYKTKNSSKVTINAIRVNNTLNHASLEIKRLLWLSVFTTLEPPYWMFSRISEVGPNRKLVPSTSRLSFYAPPGRTGYQDLKLLDLQFCVRSDRFCCIEFSVIEIGARHRIWCKRIWEHGIEFSLT